jgi:small multidrug resistance family-3 protein
MKTFFLYVATALAEIVGCYLPYLWLVKQASVWLLVLGAFSLVLFAWLLTLHEAAAGRVYAAYGGGCTSAWRWPGCGRWTACARRPGMRRVSP